MLSIRWGPEPLTTKRGFFFGGGVSDRCNVAYRRMTALHLLPPASGIGCVASTIEQSVRGSDAALRHSTVAACFSRTVTVAVDKLNSGDGQGSAEIDHQPRPVGF